MGTISMTKLDEYLEIRDTIIQPAMKKLKEEYEAQGYQCHIGTEKPQRRAMPRTISFSRRDLNNVLGTVNVKGTVSIFLSDGGWVIFNKLNVLYSSRLHLDEITTDRVKEKIRAALG